ncbi:integrase, catalytic region, zinc finger, CCHC-type containing protein [Tanacetum coccineum]|uniref:Integrase, catalytic region, zinc finger, CCHC-type containing protein n=1 Tax=Tanacetum coccineum TaxID=301880 RepID=A0ABQ5H5U7_9ASTR
MTGNLQLLRNFIKKFIGIVHFENDPFAAITRYGDYVHGNLMICHIYYVEGLRHNLIFEIGTQKKQYLKEFRRSLSFKHLPMFNLEDEDLLPVSRESNLYTISIFELVASSPVCLMSKSTSTKSWLWHRRLSHLNFGTINQLTSKDLVDGLLKFKYDKDHLCSAYLDNLFGPLYEEYYSTSPPEASNNFAANTLDNENTSSSSSIDVEEDEAPQIVSSSTKQVEPNTLVLYENADEVVQEDVAEFDGNVFLLSTSNSCRRI